MKLSTFVLPGMLSAAVNEPNPKGRFATLDDLKHYSKNGPNLDYSLLCLEDRNTGIIEQRPDRHEMPFTNSQARNGVAAFLKKNRPRLTAKESEKIIDSTMSQLKKDYIDRGYHDSPNCLNLQSGYDWSGRLDAELMQIPRLELEREAIENNKNNPVGVLGALSGLSGSLQDNGQIAAVMLGLGQVPNTPYAITELVAPNLISSAVAGYLYGVKSDNFPTATPPAETVEKIKLVGQYASTGCMVGRAVDVPGTCLTGALAGGLIGAALNLAEAKKYYLSAISSGVVLAAAFAFATREKPLKSNESLSRMAELVDPHLGDEVGAHGNYDKNEWQRTCTDLIQDVHRYSTEPQEQKTILINVVNELRNARNSDQPLQMPMNDGTGNYRGLNENENILILNLLAARMRRG